MPLKTIASHDVKFLQIIAEDGSADATLLAGIADEEIKRLFEAMITARAFNGRALSLQREGRIGTFPSTLGLEASQVGSAMAFEGGDWIFPTFRETGVFIARGYPLWMLFRYWMGDERGMKSPAGINIFPMSVPVGTQIPHAVGVAIAMKYRGEPCASAVFFGDGGSSKGDFHEGLNLAGVRKAPVVFLCQNNQWAISVPRSAQTASSTIAEKAFAYGFEGIQVDGNDVAAVYKATKDALIKAKAGNGPTLIESFTYRLDDHTTSDDASRYRKAEEVESWKKKEPFIRLRLYLGNKGLWSDAYEAGVIKKAEDAVDAGIHKAEAAENPPRGDIIRYTYDSMTPRQLREIKEFGWE